MKIVRNEWALATEMRVDNHWVRKTYNRIYLKKPHRERVYQYGAQAKHPHKQLDEKQGKVPPGNEQNSRHNIQARFWSTSANHPRKEPSRSLEYPPRKFPTHQSDEHFTDYPQSHKQKTVQLQERARIHKPLLSRFRQSRWSLDRYLLLHSPKHRNVLPSHYTDEYRNRLLCSSISNPKRLEGQDHKPGGSGAPNHQAFWIHRGKQEGSKHHANLHWLNSPCTQRHLHKPRVRREISDNPLHRSLLDNKSRTASQVCLRPNAPSWLLKKSSRRLYNTRNCSQGRVNLRKRQLTTQGTCGKKARTKLLVDR